MKSTCKVKQIIVGNAIINYMTDKTLQFIFQGEFSQNNFLKDLFCHLMAKTR